MMRLLLTIKVNTAKQRRGRRRRRMEEMWIWMERIRGALRGIFRSGQKNTSSEETLHKHHSLDRRGPVKVREV